MKLAIVYNPNDNKLQPSSYCSVFRGMFDALIARFETTQHIVNDCSADDIDADLIFFFDPHSSHHIQIDGLKNHRALKMEYWNDPHQTEVEGVYRSTLLYVHKLGREQRVKRAEARGIDFIVSPVKYAFHEYFGKYMSVDNMIHFPAAPSFEPVATPIMERKHEVLGNGATWGDHENNGYEFRRWAHRQPYISIVEHAARNSGTPSGTGYGDFLSGYAAGLALCGVFPVAKYYEIPLAGCLCFAQYHEEYRELGFTDMVNCVYVDESNFESRACDFLNTNDLEPYQKIADAGRELVAGHYTARHFADFIHDKCSDETAQRTAA